MLQMLLLQLLPKSANALSSCSWAAFLILSLLVLVGVADTVAKTQYNKITLVVILAGVIAAICSINMVVRNLAQFIPYINWWFCWGSHIQIAVHGRADGANALLVRHRSWYKAGKEVVCHQELIITFYCSSTINGAFASCYFFDMYIERFKSIHPKLLFYNRF
jgi:hypothetical protein